MSGGAQVAATTMLTSVVPPPFVGNLSIAAAQHLFFHGDARGYSIASGSLGVGFGSINSNTTGRTIVEAWLYNGIAGPDTGKVIGYKIAIVASIPLTQSAWSSIAVVNSLSQPLLSSTSNAAGVTFTTTNNGDGTWTSRWDYTTTSTVLDPVPDTFVFTLT